MISSHALSARKLLRVGSLAGIGALAACLAVLNLLARDQHSRYFATAELALALVMLGVLVHEIRVGGWRSAGR